MSLQSKNVEAAIECFACLIFHLKQVKVCKIGKGYNKVLSGIERRDYVFYYRQFMKGNTRTYI